MAWAPDYATVDDAAGYVTVPDGGDDPWLALAVSAASRAVDEHTNRQFGQVASAEERTYRAEYRGGRWVVDIDDLMTTDGLVVTVGGTPVATYRLEPRNAPQQGRPWTRLVFTEASEATPSCVGDDVV